MRSWFLLAVATVIFSAGCNGTAYHKAVVAEHDFKSAVKAFEDAEVGEFEAGNVSIEDHTAIQKGVVDVANAGQQLTVLLQENASRQTVAQQLSNVDSLLQNLLSSGVAHVKNDKTRGDLELALQAIQDIITNAEVQLQ